MGWRKGTTGSNPSISLSLLFSSRQLKAIGLKLTELNSTDSYLIIILNQDPYILVFLMSKRRSNMPVPTVIGWPMIIFQETPLILSCLPIVAASKRKSVVFSKEASLMVESFILSTPFLVNPMIFPLHVMTYERRLICLGLTLTP